MVLPPSRSPLQTSVDEAFTSPITLLTTAAIGKADLTKGAKLIQTRIPMGVQTVPPGALHHRNRSSDGRKVQRLPRQRHRQTELIMLCRCVQKCYLDNRLYRTGEEEEFVSCPAWFLPGGKTGSTAREETTGTKRKFRSRLRSLEHDGRKIN